MEKVIYSGARQIPRGEGMAENGSSKAGRYATSGVVGKGIRAKGVSRRAGVRVRW